MLQAGPEVVSIHDGFQVIHGSHAVRQLHYVGAARRPLHVVGKLKRNRGKKLGNTARETRMEGRREGKKEEKGTQSI